MKSPPVLLEKGCHCCPAVTCGTVPGAAALDVAGIHPRGCLQECHREMHSAGTLFMMGTHSCHLQDS